MGKRQPMCWSLEGAHFLLQVRFAVLDGRLETLFREWQRKPDPPHLTLIAESTGKSCGLTPIGVHNYSFCPRFLPRAVSALNPGIWATIKSGELI
jgi:hypothetical protein